MWDAAAAAVRHYLISIVKGHLGCKLSKIIRRTLANACGIEATQSI
jgi:hypothetical protein